MVEVVPRAEVVRVDLGWAMRNAFLDLGVASLRFLGAFSVEECFLSLINCLSFLFACFTRGLTTSFFCSLAEGGFGPRMPRQLADPQRHSWTFLMENGLCHGQPLCLRDMEITRNTG